MKRLLPLVVLLLGAGVMAVLGRTEPEPEKPKEAALPPLVETAAVRREDHHVQVVGQGKVVPARTLALSPAVAGRIAWRKPALGPGSTLDAGEVLLKIDPRDLMTQVSAAEEAVKRAELQLSREHAEQQVAERAWRELGGDREASDNARRAPQIAHARAQLAAAQSQLEQAKRAREQAAIRAPFAATVQDVRADVGQYVAPGQAVADLVGTDTYWVQASIPLDDLTLIRLPDGEREGSHAMLSQSVRGAQSRREASVLRLRSELSAEGGMAQLLLSVSNPTHVDEETPLPLLLGSYVDVAIEGRALDDVVQIPRTALHEGDTAYVLTSEQTLAIRPLTIAHRYRDSVIVSGGLDDGDALIVSPIPTPVEGLKLRTREKPKVAAKPKPETAS